MGRILDQTLYPPAVGVNPDDYLIGTKRNNAKKTQTFPVAEVINAVNVANGNSAMYFRYSDGSDDTITPSTPGYFFSNDNETDPDNINRLIFNDLNLGLQNSHALFDYLISSGFFVMKLTNAGNPNNVMYFNCNIGVSEHLPDHFQFEVALFNDLWQGVLVDGTTYVVDFELNSDIKTELTAIGMASVSGNDVTLSLGFEWLINNFQNANAVPFTTTRPFTSAGLIRTDIIVGNNINGFEVISGMEDANIAIQPPVPPNNVLVCVINVTDSEITTTPGSFFERPVKIIKPATYTTIFTDETKSLVAVSSGDLVITIPDGTHPENSELQITNLVDGSVSFNFEGTVEGSLVFPRYATAHIKMVYPDKWAINYRFDQATGGGGGVPNPYSKTVKWNSGDPLTFVMGAGYKIQNIFIDRVPIYGSEDIDGSVSQEWGQSGTDVTIDAAVLDKLLFDGSIIQFTGFN